MHTADLELPFAVTEMGVPDGQPIIVLPGGPCRGPEYLGDLAGLGRTHRLVILHPRGTPPSGGLSRGWWADADDVVALADRFGNTPVDVLAHSAGTRLALATAVRYPHRVRSLTLVTPPSTWLTGTPHDGDSIVLDRTNPEVADALSSLEQEDSDSEESFRASFQRQAAASYAHWTTVEQTHSRIGAVSLAAALAWFQDIPADATTRIMEAAQPPTLVIGGARDYLTGVKPVMDYAELLGGSLSLVEDCGHYPWIEQPEEFLVVTQRWLAAQHG